MRLDWMKSYSPATVLYVAPLCPAGHLPRKGGDWLSFLFSPIANFAGRAPSKLKANLPPCGGDVRQDRGGREGMPMYNASRPEL